MTKEEFENLGVGETFELGCRKFTVVETDGTECDGCFFYQVYSRCGQMFKYDFLPTCYREDRKDEKNVIFVEVEE